MPDPGFDFYGLYISADLVIDKQSHPLWLGGGQSDVGLQRSLVDPAWVTEVSIILGLGMNSKVDVTLSPPYEQGLALINSDLLRWGDGQLLVNIGYTTGSGATKTYTFGGLIQKPDVKIAADISITLHSLGIGWALNLNKPETPVSFAGMSPGWVVKQILEKYKDALDLSALYSSFSSGETGKFLTDGSIPFFQIPKNTIKKSDGTTGVEPVIISQSIKNDWWFIRDLIKVNGLDLIVTGDGEGGRNKMKVVDPEKWRKDEPTMTFILRGAIDSGARKYPILEFSSPSEFVWLTPGVGKLIARDMDLNKAVNQVEVAPGALGESKTETTSGGVTKRKLPVAMTGGNDKPSIYNTDRPGEAGTALNAGYNFPGSADQANEEVIKAELKNLFYSKGVNISVTSVGIPDLLPGQVVNVWGVGRSRDQEDILGEGKTKFDGKYGVLQVEHRIGASGFSTKFDAVNSFFPEWARVPAAKEGSGDSGASTSSANQYGPAPNDSRSLQRNVSK